MCKNCTLAEKKRFVTWSISIFICSSFVGSLALAGCPEKLSTWPRILSTVVFDLVFLPTSKLTFVSGFQSYDQLYHLCLWTLLCTRYPCFSLPFFCCMYHYPTSYLSWEAQGWIQHLQKEEWERTEEHARSAHLTTSYLQKKLLITKLLPMSSKPFNRLFQQQILLEKKFCQLYQIRQVSHFYFKRFDFIKSNHRSTDHWKH